MPDEPGADLNLLLEWPDRSSRRLLRDGLGSLAVHAVLISLAFLLAWLPTSPPAAPREDETETRQAIRLVAPPLRLTQKTPTLREPAKEVSADDLLAEKRRPSLPAPPRPRFVPPPPEHAPSPRITPPPVATPPRIEALNKVPQIAPPGVTTQAPAPRIQQQEEPKLALQTPGAPAAGGPEKHIDFGRMPFHRMSVDEAVRSAVEEGPGGLQVGDPDDLTPIKPDVYGRMPSQTHNSGRVELLSDPHGIDFKPYLTRVLLSVKKNWQAIMPESARLGRRGIVVVQFIISRDGEVPKLVISMPSGTDAFDRAAVAGISASNPFPPLPADYPGNDIRLQLSFSYNIPRR
jgi:TonB family protein